jgi:DNA (cytosine-5)-methyltransferase 1
MREGAMRSEIRFDGLAGCLRTPKGGSGKQIVIAVQGGKVKMRWMSAIEYAKLQGAPSFNVNFPRNQALTGFADAVCVPVIEWIDKHVLSFAKDGAELRSFRRKARAIAALGAHFTLSRQRITAEKNR